MKRLIHRIFRIRSKRYFVIFYSAPSQNRSTSIGCINFVCTGINPGPNRDEFAKQIKENNPEFAGIVFTGMTELSKHDYKIWIDKNEDNE